jgi:hypothetical protein
MKRVMFDRAAPSLSLPRSAGEGTHIAVETLVSRPLCREAGQGTHIAIETLASCSLSREAGEGWGGGVFRSERR